MKIFLVSNMYPSIDNPRYGVFVKRFEEEMNALGIGFLKATMTAKYDKPIYVKLFSYLKLYVCIFIKGLSLQYEMIYVHFPSHISPILYLLSFIVNKPLVLNFHGNDAFIQTRMHKFFHFFLKKIIKKTSLFVVPSEYYKQVIAEEFNVSIKNINVYPSGGINKEVFKVLDQKTILKTKKKLDIKGDEFVFGFVSSFIFEKGWSFFLDLINDLSETNSMIKAIMIGGGKEHQEVKQRIIDLNLRQKVIILDAVKQDSLPLYYNIMDVFIFPTISKTESLGLVGLEALSCGVPVIASEIGGPSGYVIDNYNGFLFKPGNLNELLSKTEKYISLEKSDKIKFCDNAIETANKYERTLVNKKLHDILISINNEN